MLDIATTMDTVCKWNIRYDGGNNALAFTEQLEDLAYLYEISLDIIPRAMPILLTDQALIWHRNNKCQWLNWLDFRRDFLKFFLPAEYLAQLEDDIRNRQQENGEAFKHYVLVLQDMMRHANWDTERQLTRIYRNSNPDFQLYVKQQEFSNLDELIRLAKDFEHVQRLVRTEPKHTIVQPKFPVRRSAFLQSTPNHIKQQRASKRPSVEHNTSSIEGNISVVRSISNKSSRNNQVTTSQRGKQQEDTNHGNHLPEQQQKQNYQHQHLHSITSNVLHQQQRSQSNFISPHTYITQEHVHHQPHSYSQQSSSQQYQPAVRKHQQLLNLAHGLQFHRSQLQPKQCQQEQQQSHSQHSSPQQYQTPTQKHQQLLNSPQGLLAHRSQPPPKQCQQEHQQRHSQQSSPQQYQQAVREHQQLSRPLQSLQVHQLLPQPEPCQQEQQQNHSQQSLAQQRQPLTQKYQQPYSSSQDFQVPRSQAQRQRQESMRPPQQKENRYEITRQTKKHSDTTTVESSNDIKTEVQSRRLSDFNLRPNGPQQKVITSPIAKNQKDFYKVFKSPKKRPNMELVSDHVRKIQC